MIIKLPQYLYADCLLVPLYDDKNNFIGNSFMPNKDWTANRKPEHKIKMLVGDMTFIKPETIMQKPE